MRSGKLMWVGVMSGVLLGGVAYAELLRNLENAPGLVGLTLPGQWKTAQKQLVRTAARQLPVAASQASATFAYDPATGTYTRMTNSLGPMPFFERADTLGRHMWNIGLSGQYLELNEYDGAKVGKDPYPVIAGGSPTVFYATPKPIYHLGTFNVTYGVLEDLDVNVAIPLINRDFDFNVPTGNPAKPLIASHNNISLTVGDIHLRGKYRTGELLGWTTAVGLDLRVPTGDLDEATGTGDVEVGPSFAMSDVFAERVEMLVNAGFDWNASESRRSSAHYAMAVNVITCRFATLTGGVLGRSDVDSWNEAHSISGPHAVNGGVQNLPYGNLNFADRKDYFDATIGAKFRLGEHAALTAGVFKAINDDGLRSSIWSPVVGVEGWF